MDLDHLRTFRTVARTGSFTAAADLLHYAQSTVSVHVRALEAEIGVPLFDRLPAGTRLTEAGQRLAPVCERILDLVADAAAIAADPSEATGEITVAAPETVVAHRLPAILTSLRDRHPAVRVRLEAVPYRQVRSAVTSGLVDVGFLLQPPVAPTSMLAVRSLWDEPLRMVAASGHPLARRIQDPAEEFAQTTLFLTERGCGYRPLVEARLDGAGIQPGHVLELDSVEAIRRCVEAGLGVAVIPDRWLGDSLARGTLAPMDWFMPRLEVTTQLVWHADRWRGPALNAFLEASALASRRTPAPG